MASLDREAQKRSHLFIELEEYNGRKWQETGRWNHALEEDRNDSTQSWSSPHLPTISFHALIQLRAALGATNVMLDVPGKTFASVQEVVLNGLVATGKLKQEDVPRIQQALKKLGEETPGESTAFRRRRISREDYAPPRANALEKPAVEEGAKPADGRVELRRAKQELPTTEVEPAASTRGPPNADGKSAGEGRRQARVSREHIALVPPQSPGKSKSSPPSSPKAPNSPESAPNSPEKATNSPDSGGLASPQSGEAKDWFAMLAPDADEEALDLLIAHVSFVDKPVMAFVRCAEAIDAGCESHAPVRYIFLLIGPENDMAASSAMAHALAGVMLDEQLVAGIAEATNPHDFLRVLDKHLEHVAILPHVHMSHTHQAGHGSGNVSHGHGHSTSASSDSNAESNDDEDEVVMAEVEDHLRSTKGMTPLDPTRKNGSAHGGSSWQREQKKQRRPSFADALTTEAGMLSTPSEAIARGKTPRPSAETPVASIRMFIELEQCLAGEWQETHHWNWAFEQEATKDGAGWSLPHLPTISAKALMALYKGLGEHNVLLNVQGATFPEVAKSISSAFVRTGHLDVALQQRATDLIASRTGATPHAAPSSPRPNLLDLSPDLGEEAFDLLIVHTDIVNEPALAFVRMATPIDYGCEKAAPVRFIFALLAPLSRAGAKSGAVQMATALAALMLDQDFVAALRTCATVPTFIELLGRQMNCITVVPHSHVRKETAAASEEKTASKSWLPKMGKAVSPNLSRRNSAQNLRAVGPEPMGSGPASKGASPQPVRPRSRNASTESVPRIPHLELPTRAPTSAPPVDKSLVLTTAAATAGHHSRPSVDTTEGATTTDTHPPRPAPMLRRSTTMKLVGPLVRKRAQSDKRVGLSEVRKLVLVAQRFSLPLLLGIFIALIWANVDPSTYEYFVGSDYHLPHWSPLGDKTYLFGHKVTLHFLVNDIFMVFFFGIAAKEVTEACLPGGSLNPIRKALSPLVGTVAGVAAPICVYLIVTYVCFAAGAFEGYESKEAIAAREDLLASAAGGIDGHGIVDVDAGHHRMLGSSSGSHGSSDFNVNATPYNFSSPEAQLGFSELARGWAVPTATDISLAWMVAVQVFPLRHPAIEFLLLLAVADDAIGLVIIASAYSDPDHPFVPAYLLLILAGVVASLLLRKLPFATRNMWLPYILFGGVPCWCGLIGAALHPALALVFVVPFLPAAKLPVKRLFKGNTAETESHPGGEGGAASEHGHHDLHAPLHAFEHAMKLPVDLGMFFFTLANAGVRLEHVGAVTLSIFLALFAGKLIGISFLVLLADKVKCAPLNSRVKTPDVLMVSSMAGIGLTVALFIAGEAFQQERLQSEAKLGALLSGLIGAACIAFGRTPCWTKRWKKGTTSDATPMIPNSPTLTPLGWPRLHSSHYDYEDVADIVAATLERSLLLQRANTAELNLNKFVLAPQFSSIAEEDSVLPPVTSGSHVVSFS